MRKILADFKKQYSNNPKPFIGIALGIGALVIAEAIAIMFYPNTSAATISGILALLGIIIACTCFVFAFWPQKQSNKKPTKVLPKQR